MANPTLEDPVGNAKRKPTNHAHAGNYTLSAEDLTLIARHEPMGPLDVAARPTTLRLAAVGSPGDNNGVIEVEAADQVHLRGGGGDGIAQVHLGKQGVTVYVAQLPADLPDEAVVHVGRKKIKMSVGPLASMQIEPKEISLKVAGFGLTINGDPSSSDCGITLKVNDQKIQLKIDEVTIKALAATLQAPMFTVKTTQMKVKV